MNKNRFFCTLFDKNYLIKGVVMLDSLLRYCADATVFVLCMDDETYRLLKALKLKGAILLKLSEVECSDLLRVKPGRSIAEYCWTLSASLCWHIMQTRADVETLTYLDADLMFSSDIEPLFAEINSASIAIIEHRFMSRLAHLEAYGRFNVEWVGFRRTDAGLKCLKVWRDQCIEWCFARLEDDRLGDQKYLDSWPSDYSGDLHILQNKGAGVAPWNFSNYSYYVKDERIFVDDVPLVFYHFHQFQILTGGRYDYVSSIYTVDANIPSVIYDRYVSELRAVLARIRSIEPDFSAGIRPALPVILRRTAQKYLPIGIKNAIRRFGIQMW